MAPTDDTGSESTDDRSTDEYRIEDLADTDPVARSTLRSGEPRIVGRVIAALSEGLGLTLVANWFYLPLTGVDSTWGHLALASFGGIVVLSGVVAHRGDTPWLALPFPTAGLALIATTPGFGLGSLSVTLWANLAAVATIVSLPLVWYLWQTVRQRHAARKRV